MPVKNCFEKLKYEISVKLLIYILYFKDQITEQSLTMEIHKCVCRLCLIEIDPEKVFLLNINQHLIKSVLLIIGIEVGIENVQKSSDTNISTFRLLKMLVTMNTFAFSADPNWNSAFSSAQLAFRMMRFFEKCSLKQTLMKSFHQIRFTWKVSKWNS